MNQQEKLHLINEIFTPSSPIENKSLFFGRHKELKEIKETLEEKGQHAVMYGPRGAGKTSLANMVQYLFDNLLTIKITCHRNDNFKTIWERALRKIKFFDQIPSPGYLPQGKAELISINPPELERINPTEIENILSSLEMNILFIFDEFDIMRNSDVKAQMADMIKLFSDNQPHITILIVGISQSVDKLIGEHQSIERCIRQIEVPLMREKESKELVNDNMQLLELTVKKPILENMIDLSSGFPNYLHLLCKYSAIEAIKKEKDEITSVIFNLAVQKSIENSDHSIRNAYQKAIGNTSTIIEFSHLILACALSETDHNNSFSTNDVAGQFLKISGKQHSESIINQNLNLLCKRDKAEILTRLGRQKDARFRFRKPLLKAFVKLKMYQPVEV
jgi:Cdc6-like AAA superfamily ATPase